MLAFDVRRRTVRAADNIPVAISHMLVDHFLSTRIVAISRVIVPKPVHVKVVCGRRGPKVGNDIHIASSPASAYSWI